MHYCSGETRRDEDRERERGRGGGREGEREEMLENDDEEKEGNFLSFWSMFTALSLVLLIRHAIVFY
jgi:hypothetical protein